jgi:hypothetical protein
VRKAEIRSYVEAAGGDAQLAGLMMVANAIRSLAVAVRRAGLAAGSVESNLAQLAADAAIALPDDFMPSERERRET